MCVFVCVCTDTWLSICGEGFKGIVCTVAYIRGLAVCLCAYVCVGGKGHQCVCGRTRERGVSVHVCVCVCVCVLGETGVSVSQVERCWCESFRKISLRAVRDLEVVSYAYIYVCAESLLSCLILQPHGL